MLKKYFARNIHGTMKIRRRAETRCLMVTIRSKRKVALTVCYKKNHPCFWLSAVGWSSFWTFYCIVYRTPGNDRLLPPLTFLVFQQAIKTAPPSTDTRERQYAIHFTFRSSLKTFPMSFSLAYGELDNPVRRLWNLFLTY